MKTLFLAWQAPQNSARSRAWFTVGRLDADVEAPTYRFRYTHGAMTARKSVGFDPLLAFPNFEEDYRSSELFPLFQNRVISPKRNDFPEFIGWLALDGAHTDPVSILSVSGGGRATDNLEVFPNVVADAHGSFRVRFFLHGLRHLGEASAQRASALRNGDSLRVFVELNNPVTGRAVALLTDDYQMIGWAPRYLVDDLIRHLPEASAPEVRIARVNADPAPLSQRFLVDYEWRSTANSPPMSSHDFVPLTEDAPVDG